MRILALGGLWVPYIRENWFDALEHTLGAQVTIINAGALFPRCSQRGRAHEGFHTAYVYDVLRRDKYDYLFFYHDWIFGDYPDSFFEKVRASGVRTIAFHPDDEPEHWYRRNAPYDHHYDLVASHSKAGTARRQAENWGERVLYLQWGYSPRTCYPIPTASKKYDVVFIGKHKVDSVRGVTLVEDGDQREKLLVKLAQECERHGWTFRIFGHGWDRHPVLRKWAGGVLSQEGMVQVYNESRIVFNPAWSSDGDPNAVQTKLRHFEVPGCGAFQITNQNDELAELFEAGKEIEFFRNDTELLDKISFYLRHEAAREEIAAAGLRRAQQEHTLDKRITDLFAHARKLFPVDTQPIRQHPVRRIDFTDLDALRPEHYEPVQDGEWLHFAGGHFADLRTNYGTAQTFMAALPDTVLSCATYIQYTGVADNPLQPKAMETDSALLDERTDVNDFGFGSGGPCESIFAGTREEHSARLMSNYLVPASKVSAFVQAFKGGSIHDIDALEAFPTGRVIAEVSILPPPGQGAGTIRNHEYVRRLRKILPMCQRLNMRIAVYGINGMGEIVFRLGDELPGFKFAGVIDRSLEASTFHDIPVLRPEALGNSDIDLIILAAGNSGPSIYRDIEKFESSVCILPLYDLEHPAWHLFGAFGE